MKFVFKMILITFFSTNYSHSREVVIVNLEKNTSKESMVKVENALTKYLGIPKKFISIKNVSKNQCTTINKSSVIGICIIKKNIDVFYVNKKIYENTIKKIIELHKSSDNEVKNV